LSDEERRTFFLFIDLEGKGKINYAEFIRLLKRCGLEAQSSDEKIAHIIYDII
jgi:Ca2+-binding EF-hand superfamily protein